ncbi:MAG: aminopeptidase N [Bdellovibrionaceae bacterium]|nr:aminopeptidase N [Bdellovibrio sp.]
MKSDSNSNQPQRIFLTDYLPPSFSIDSVQLYFNLHETKTQVKAKIDFKKIKDEALVLNGVGLKLLSIKLNEKPLAENSYKVEAETLTIPNVPDAFTLETIVEINPEENKACVGLYLSRGIFATQCEAEGFRHITYFIDRPDVMTNYSVELEADKTKYPILLSNGDHLGTQDLGNGRHLAQWKDPFKKPCYLFALVAGDLGVVTDSFTTHSGKKVKLEVFASHGKQSRCLHAMQSLKNSMKWDEERFGLEYDLNQFMIVSIDDFNMGAMENKGLNIFNSRLVLADPESATDTDFERIESVVGHEYFHNWTGNRVTCRNWFELSLKEGLTVFRDQEFSADLNSRPVQRIKDVDALRGSQFAEDAGPNAHPVRPESCLAVDNFYTSTIYEKGSEVIRMMQTMVGKKGFRKGMDEYFRRHDGQAVTIIDFANAISEPNGYDFTQFKLWYTQAGTPEVSVHEDYNADKKEFSLTLKQSCAPSAKQPNKLPFHIPLLIGLLDSRGQDMTIESDDLVINSDQLPVLHLKNSEQKFIFKNISEKPVLSINRDFSAPIKLNWQASPAEMLHLLKYDSDAFNRREACYKMILQELKRLITGLRGGASVNPQASVLDALGFVLNDSQIDVQFKALMLQLPGVDILAQEEDVLDAVAFNKAEKLLIIAFVKQNEKQILDLYKMHHALDSVGDRALKNRLLSFLVLAEIPQAVAMASQQFIQAKNMTDQLGALAILCQTDSSEKTSALQVFYDRWKDDAVVFNKWLMVQAYADLPQTFDTVKKLTQIKPFSLENPNNVFSLHRVFGENFLALAQTKGEAYKWLCDEILTVDKKNPQVAARLCGSFNFVKKLPDQLKQKAQTEIKRMLATDSLSKNSRELLESCI